MTDRRELGEPPPRPDPSSASKIFGGLLAAAGILIFSLCGLCTGYFQIGFLHTYFTTRSGMKGVELVSLFIPLLIGLLPILIGIGLLMWGRALLRSRPLLPR